MKFLFLFLLITLFSAIIIRLKRKTIFPYGILVVAFLSLFGVSVPVQGQGIVPKEDSSTDSLSSISYFGVSLLYPNGWTVEKESLINDCYNMILYHNFDDDSFNIISLVWVKDDVDINKMILNAIEGMRGADITVDILNDIHDSKFRGSDCRTTDGKLSASETSWYGRFTAFKLNGYSVLMMKQAESLEKLETNFKIIENSFKVE